MISKWKYNYTDEEKGMALTIINKNQEINKLVDELEEQERHIKEADFEIERLHSIIKEVREYITSYINQFNGVYPPVDMRYLDLNKILEILDGVDKENI